MISVLLPVFNDEKHIAFAIQSILNQTYKDFELLIIDDGSTDDTPNVVKSFSDNRIQYFSKKHSGLGDSLNFGIKNSKYKYIARMDADDIAFPNRLEKQLNFMRANPKVDILSSWYADFNDRIIYITKTAASNQEIKKKLLLWADICHPCVMMKKNTIVRLGGYLTNTYEKDVFVDYKFWLKIKDQVVFHNLQEFLLLKRYSLKTLSRDNISLIKNIHFQIQQKYYENLEQHFGIYSEAEKNYYKGLREYFWGDKNKARKYWLKLGNKIIKFPKVFFVFPFTFLSQNMLNKFNEFRIWQRIDMYKMKIKKDGRKALKELNQFLRNFKIDNK